MITLQIVSAAMSLLNRASLLTGMNPMVFTVYRQAIAASVTFPICYFTRGKSGRSEANTGIRSLVLIFVFSFIGMVLCQLLYWQGLYMTSSSIGTASSNLTPAITFIFAVILGMEQVSLRKLSSIAKIGGTILCVGGSICIALLRGPKILNMPNNFLSGLESSTSDKDWILGCLSLFASKSCWAVWLIMQVHISKCYPDPLSLSDWMSLIGMLQAAAIAAVMVPDPRAWNLSSSLELASCFFSGILGSGAKYYILAWCVPKRGPFFSSVFGPLSTVIATISACILLHEELYVGSLLGAVAVIIGLYIVLWGIAEELNGISHSKPEETQVQEHKILENDLEQPLVTDDRRH